MDDMKLRRCTVVLTLLIMMGLSFWTTQKVQAGDPPNTITPGVTTFGDAFMDAGWRAFIMEDLLGIPHNTATVITNTHMNTIRATQSLYINWEEEGTYRSIFSLAHLDQFTSLKNLYCYAPGMTDIDLSQNPTLTAVSFYRSNSLRYITLGNLPNLEYLDLSYTYARELDLSGCPKLSVFYASDSTLEILNISQNKKLIDVNLFGTYVTEIDTTKSTALEYLNISYTDIASLNLTKNTKLLSLSCDNTPITTLNVSKNTLLETLTCNDTALSQLDLSTCPQLTFVTADNCKLPDIKMPTGYTGYVRADNQSVDVIVKGIEDGKYISAPKYPITGLDFMFPTVTLDPLTGVFLLNHYLTDSPFTNQRFGTNLWGSINFIDNSTLTLSSFSLNKSVLTLNVGKTATLKVAATVPDNYVLLDPDLNWSSSNPSVVSLTGNFGQIRALRGGTAVITCTTPEGITSSCTVTVSDPANPRPLTGFTLNKTAISMNLGKTATLSVTTFTPSDTTSDMTPTWSSSNPLIVNLTGKGGQIRAHRGGTAVISCTIDGITVSCTVTVIDPTNPRPLTGFTLNKTAISMNLGKTATLSVTSFTPSDTTSDMTPAWKSSNPAIVSLTGKGGQVRAISAGTATITCTVDGLSVSCTVTVKDPTGGTGTGELIGFTLNKTTLKMTQGKTATLSVTSYTPTDTTSTKVESWSSSDPSIVNLTGKGGQIRALKPGTAIITCTIDGISVSCTVTV